MNGRTEATGGDPAPARWRQHLLVFAAALGLALAALAAFNFSIDPFGVYRVVPLPALHDYREGLESTLATAEILEHHRCELVILGTSRAQVALDPEHSAWGRPACNLSLAGAGIADVRGALRHVLANPTVREIVWTVDLLSFRRGDKLSANFSHSRFNPELSAFDYHASLLAGGDALRASLRVLRNYRGDVRSPTSELGLTNPGLRMRQRSFRERFLWSLQRDVAEMIGTRHYQYDPETVAASAALAAEAQQQGRAVTLVILPSHVLHYETLARFGQWETFERWKTDWVEGLAEHTEIPLWDCSGYAAELTEPVPPAGDAAEMHWHWDSAHVKRTLGDALVTQIRLAPADHVAEARGPELCTRLDRDSLPRALARTRAAQEHYRSSPENQLDIIEAARRLAEHEDTAGAESAPGAGPAL